MSSSCCSQCSNNGDNSSTCPGSKGFMLFGVRVTTDGYSIRKSASMNNLSQFDQQPDHRSDLAAGYASDDVVLASAGTRDRKRGVPWTEEEHRLFLIGLQKMGKGDWRGISRNFVKSRTPTQVASHAQKYFLRRNNLNRRRRRSSLFDLTTDTVPILFPGGETENQPLRQDKAPAPKIVKPIPVIPAMVRDLNQRSGMKSSSLSLKLLEQRHTAFQAMSSSVNNGDLDSNSSMICVA